MRRPSLLLLAGLALLASGAAARAQHEYAPDNARQTIDSLRFRCAIAIFCPIGGEVFDVLSRAVDGDRDAQFQIGEILEFGRGLIRDDQAAVAWYAKAAEQGHVRAALKLNEHRHQGAAIDADEGKIASALQTEIAKGNADAMRALADMAIYGRGVPRSADQAIQLLRRAAEKGSADAEADLAQLYLIGAPGIPRNPAEGIRWLVVSGRHGNLESMYRAGSAYVRSSDTAIRDPAEGYRWLMRASLIDYPRAQEDLAVVLADGVMLGARIVIAPDPVRADMWLRLAARSPFHDNPAIRYRIETGMTSVQLEQAKKLAADWRPLTLPESLAMTIDPPPVAGAKRPWPPGLMGDALRVFEQASDNPEPWQRLPDFDRNDEVMVAIAAIAAHCEQNGQKGCADFCRRQREEVAPPIRPGGIPFEELAKYLQAHPEVSASWAMRKTAVTPDQAMNSWVICADRVADRP